MSCPDTLGPGYNPDTLPITVAAGILCLASDSPGPQPRTTMHPPPPQGAYPHSAPSESVTRVLVADRHPVVRAGLKALLGARSDLRVVGEAADGPEALRLAADLNPDVVVVEVNLP